MSALGIIAGGGELPIAVAESAREAGRAVFVIGIRGSADDTIEAFPHAWTGLGEVGATLKHLRANHCSDVILVGRVARPKFSDIKVDGKGMLLLPKVIAAARRGDDALLNVMVQAFDAEGFRTVGVAQAAPGLLAQQGVFGRVAPSAEAQEDVATAVKVVRSLGRLDVGQAAAVCEGLVLAVEAAEGTDAMVARVASLPEAIRGTPTRRRGVLVKALKPRQDGKTDLPVIGVATVKNAAAAGLSGIAVEAGQALVINRRGVIDAADAAGLFVLAFAPDAYPD